MTCHPHGQESALPQIEAHGEIEMLWIVLLVVGVAITFNMIGAMSVWIALFSLGFKAMVIAGGLYALWFIWKQIFSSKS